MSVVFNFTVVQFQLLVMGIVVLGHSRPLFIYTIEQVFFQYKSESIGLKVDESVLLLLFWHNFFPSVNVICIYIYAVQIERGKIAIFPKIFRMQSFSDVQALNFA